MNLRTKLMHTLYSTGAFKYAKYAYMIAATITAIFSIYYGLRSEWMACFGALVGTALSILGSKYLNIVEERWRYNDTKTIDL